MVTNPKVTIFILNWNRKAETSRAIKSALDQSYSNIEILIVDNGSSDGSSEYIQKLFPNIRFIQLDKNYGCPGGRNRGIPYCNGEFILFCDNDGVLHKNSVENAVNYIIQDNGIAVVTGFVQDFNEESDINTSYLLPFPVFKEVCLFQGGISLHRKTIYSEVGYYPDDYMYGGEETFLSYKILDAGYKIVKSKQVILWHKRSELARNYSKEAIQGWGNALMNAYQLFPIEYFLAYFIYFFTVYPIYAIQSGFLKTYLNALLTYLKRLKNYKRDPVKRSTYKMFRKMK